MFFFFFFFNDTATTEIYTLSLHDALPICRHDTRNARLLARGGHHHTISGPDGSGCDGAREAAEVRIRAVHPLHRKARSEEHTSELQSQSNLVCRLLLEKKKKNNYH